MSWQNSLATLSQFSGSMYGILGSSEAVGAGLSVPVGSETSSLPVYGGFCVSPFPTSSGGNVSDHQSTQPVPSAACVSTEVSLHNVPSSAAGVSGVMSVHSASRQENDKLNLTAIVAADLLGHAVMSTGLDPSSTSYDGVKSEVETSEDPNLGNETVEVKANTGFHDSEVETQLSRPTKQQVISSDVPKTASDSKSTSETSKLPADVPKTLSPNSKSNSVESSKDGGLEPGELSTSKSEGVVLDEISDSEFPPTPRKGQSAKEESRKLEESLKIVTDKYEKKRQEDRKKYPPYLPHQSASKRPRESFAYDKPYPPPRRHSFGRPVTSVTSSRDFHKTGPSQRDGHSNHATRDYRPIQFSRNENSSGRDYAKAGNTNYPVLNKSDRGGTKLETSTKSEVPKSGLHIEKPATSRNLTDKELLEQDLALSDEDCPLPSVPTPPPTPTVPCDPSFSLKVLDVVSMQAHHLYVEGLGLPVKFK